MAAYLSILSLLLLLSTAYAAAGASCNSEDKNALLAIKASFQNPDILADWVDATDCCTWDRIRCDADSGRVIHIYISGSNALSGSLPETLSSLPFLRTIFVSDLPLLTGHIPQSITRLPHLASLVITNTSLSGPIPSFISQIPSLKFLDLSDNKFIGWIPEDLPLLRGLTNLRLSNNRLTGGIPATFGNFNISSPPLLDLSNNRLSGEIPPELGHVDWGHVDVSNNQLKGDASALLGAGKRTTRMNLSGNRLQFNLSRVSFPTGLKILYLNRNQIDGSIPAQINLLEELRGLNLSDNNLCGEIPSGSVTRKFGKEAFKGNKCLCGPPLDPCPQSG